jgi:hypothetical protein
MKILMLLVDLTLLICYDVFLVTACVLRANKELNRGQTNRVPLYAFHVTKWPALAGMILEPFFEIYLYGHIDMVSLFFDVLGLIGWYFLRNVGDDDWWKKRKEKMRDKVVQLGQKLVVIPEPA